MNHDAKYEAENWLYTLGELLAVEEESVKEVRYRRDAVNSLFVVLENGKKLKITVEEEKE